MVPHGLTDLGKGSGLVFCFPGQIQDVPPLRSEETNPRLRLIVLAFMADFKSINYVILWIYSGII